MHIKHKFLVYDKKKGFLFGSFLLFIW